MKKLSTGALVAYLLLGVVGVHAADITPPADVLRLSDLMASAYNTHPQLRLAQGEVVASQKDVDAVRRLRWPDLSVTFETESSQASSAPARVARFDQTVWDFGRVSGLLSESEAKILIAELQVDIRKQDIGLQLVSAWQQLVSASRKLTFAQEAEGYLSQLDAQMQRRVAVQTSPLIDLELLNARRLQAKVDRASHQAQWESALDQLVLVSGMAHVRRMASQMEAVPSGALLDELASTIANMDVEDIALSHAMVRRAEVSHKAMQHQLEARQSDLLPHVYVRIDVPLSRSGAGTSSAKPAWFAGVKYSTGAGFSSSAQTVALATRVEAALHEVGASRIEIERAIRADQQEFFSAHARLSALAMSVEGAKRVLDSYQRQFVAGRRGWLDLLNAARELTQTQYQLSEAEASLAGALGRLRIRTAHQSILNSGV